jgi:hypothetical protein
MLRCEPAFLVVNSVLIIIHSICNMYACATFGPPETLLLPEGRKQKGNHIVYMPFSFPQ